MTEQEIFTRAFEALRDRGFTRAGNIGVDGNFSCRYRDSNGCCCAAGLFITNEEYSERMEGTSIGYVLMRHSVAALERVPLDLLSDLQAAHDKGNSPENMEYRLRMLAEQYSLTVPEPRP